MFNPMNGFKAILFLSSVALLLKLGTTSLEINTWVNGELIRLFINIGPVANGQ